MDSRMVDVPIARLLDPDLTPGAKVVWMALRLNAAASPADLEGLTGLARPTILSGLRQIRGLQRAPGGPRARVPAALLAERRVGGQAKVLYGLLQATPDCRGHHGRFTYASLCSLTQLSRNTLKRAMADLMSTGWVDTAQASRLRPIHFRLGRPEWRRSQAEAAAALRRLKRAKFGGEAIMQEYLSLLIDSDQFTDNARPGFLVNPLTGERLEFDRFYPPNLAFEFHGAQHDRVTDRFSQAEVEQQQVRDLIKAGICVYRGIQLVIIRAEDLSLQAMSRKVGQILPLRNLAGHERLIDLLEDASITYCAASLSR